MPKLDDLTATALNLLAKKMEPKLKAALEAHGVSSPTELPPDIAQKILIECMTTTAAESFPGAQLDALKHTMTAFGDPTSQAAIARLKSEPSTPSDAFSFASGSDAAIALASFGLPVAPFDRKIFRILAEPSNDISVVSKNFAKWKSAYVGYSPCDIPFYVLMTDCMRTMCSLVRTHEKLDQVRNLLARSGVALPTGPFSDFKHGMLLLPREPGDTISTIHLNNPSPSGGSIMFLAGWSVGGQRLGAPNDGFFPVPKQFLRSALNEPEVAMWVWRPVGMRVIVH